MAPSCLCFHRQKPQGVQWAAKTSNRSQPLFQLPAHPQKGASQSGRLSPETQPRGWNPTAATEYNICPRLPRGKPNQSEFAQCIIEPSCSSRQEEDVRAVLPASIQGSVSPDSTQRDLFSSGHVSVCCMFPPHGGFLTIRVAKSTGILRAVDRRALRGDTVHRSSG